MTDLDLRGRVACAETCARNPADRFLPNRGGVARLLQSAPVCRTDAHTMNRTEFIIAATIILFGAYMLGWFTHWLLHRFTRVAGGDMAEIDRLAQSLHDAEEMRDQALVYMETREAELVNQVQQTEAELRAAMDGLRAARHEGEEMRAYIERIHAAG